VNGFEPSPGVRYLYCAKPVPWFQCDCRWSEEVRAGKRPRPQVKRLADGRTVIVVDEETVARNPLGMPRYSRGHGNAASAAPVETAEMVTPPQSVVTRLVTPMVTVVTPVVTRTEANGEPERVSHGAGGAPKRDRAAYMRDRRAAERAAAAEQDGATDGAA
jgi:hypothetical protein